MSSFSLFTCLLSVFSFESPFFFSVPSKHPPCYHSAAHVNSTCVGGAGDYSSQGGSDLEKQLKGSSPFSECFLLVPVMVSRQVEDAELYQGHVTGPPTWPLPSPPIQGRLAHVGLSSVHHPELWCFFFLSPLHTFFPQILRPFCPALQALPRSFILRNAAKSVPQSTICLYFLLIKTHCGSFVFKTGFHSVALAVFELTP